MFIESKYTSPCLLNRTYCIKTANLHVTLRNKNPVGLRYMFSTLTNNFPLEDSCPIIIPHEFIQPVDFPFLEKFHITKFNHKLYNLIQIINHEFSATAEEHHPRTLELLWPLLRTQVVIRMLAKRIRPQLQLTFPMNFLGNGH